MSARHAAITEAAGRVLADPTWTGHLLARCAWCKTPMGERPCPQSQDGQVTDSICSACEKQFRSGAAGPEVKP